MQQTMKALVKREAAKGIWMEQVPLPEIGPNEVLVNSKRPRSVARTCTSTSGTNGRSA